jgi:transposase
LKLDLEKPPTEYGIEKGYWTTPLINRLIEEKAGIKYSKSRICELMKEWGFAIKRPRMKSKLADEKKQKEFIELSFPNKVEETAEKAKMMGLKLLLLFTDEAGIRRDGTIHNGWYKIGIIPEIPESNGRFESVKLLGAVGTLDGSIHINTVEGKITTKVYANFLIGLSRRYKEYLILIVQDSAPWHGKKKLPVLLKDAGVKNIVLCNFPKYSPDMNPCEKLWKWLRETVTHCRYYEDMKELKQSIWRFYRRAYNQKELAIKRFKTEKNIFEYVKTYGKDLEQTGTVRAVA